MTHNAMFAHEEDLVSKGYSLKIAKTWPYKKGLPKFWCIIEKRNGRTLHRVSEFNDELYLAKRNAILKVYDEINERKYNP